MTLALVDCRIPDGMERALLLRGFKTLRLPPYPALPEAIASHPDTLIFKYKDRLYAYADYAECAPYVFTDVRDAASGYRLYFTADTAGKEYPHDCALNARVVGKRLVASPKSVSDSIKELAREMGLETLATKQGYPACTTLCLGDKAAISADRGMIKALSSIGVDCLEIEQGAIALPPYEYGFIGGACGVFRDTVYFFGNLGTHPSADKIEAFLAKHGYRAISLSDGGLLDLGGIVFLE